MGRGKRFFAFAPACYILFVYRSVTRIDDGE